MIFEYNEFRSVFLICCITRLFVVNLYTTADIPKDDLVGLCNTIAKLIVAFDVRVQAVDPLPVISGPFYYS